MQYPVMLILVSVLFLQGCVCGMKEEMKTLQKENISLRETLAKKETESALAKKDLEMQLALLKKDAEMEKQLSAVRMKALEKDISEKDAKLKNSVSADLVFQSCDSYNYQLPTVLLDIWLNKNKPPKNASKSELGAFAVKLLPIARYCHNSPVNQQKLLSVIFELPESFLDDLIAVDTGSAFSFVFDKAAQRMDKAALKRYYRITEGKGVHWAFANRLWMLADEKDKEWIMQCFWTNNIARQKAIKYGFHKEILPEIKKRVMENYRQYPDLLAVVEPLFTPEEKETLLKKIWESNQKSGGSGNLWNLLNTAHLFLENGYVPAFVQIGLLSPYLRQYDPSKISVFVKYSPVPFDDLQDWVLKNYGNIVFDGKTKKFIAGRGKDAPRK